jgi:hypothetical protein
VIDVGETGLLVDDCDGAAAVLKNIEAFDRGACYRKFQERFLSSRMAADYLRIYHRLAPGRVLAATRTAAG